MAGVRIVTDSSCDLTVEETEELGVEVVPLTVRFGTEEFVDRTELTVDDFYRRMAESSELPQTAAPAPGAFEKAFRGALDNGADGVVCINLSSQMSATMQSAQTGANAIEGADIRVIDSRSITTGLGSMVRWAALAARDGMPADAIAAGVESQVGRTKIWGVLDTLDNLKKGGRIGGAKAMLAGVLSIKPAISIQDGVVAEAGKPRTRGKALQWLADRLLAEPTVEQLCVVHGNAPDLDPFLDLIAATYPRTSLTVGKIGPIIGTHGGPRVIGVTYQLPA